MYKNNQGTKSKKGRYRIDMVILSCLVVFVACFIIYMINGELVPAVKKSGSDQSTITNQKPSVTDQSKAVTESNPSKVDSSSQATSVVDTPGKIVNPVPASEKQSITYYDKTVFIGDSLTVGLAGYNIVPAQCVIASIGLNISKIDTEKITTPSGSTAPPISATALETLKQKKPENIYIMLGSNGIAWLSNESMINKYSAFIDNIKQALPQSRIYILSIPPVTSERENAAESPIKNAAIDKYNSELLKMANAKGLYFVDLNTAIKNNAGRLDTDKAQKDGMHFKQATYVTMIDYILTHVAK